MNDFEFYSPTRFVFGRGVTDAVGQHVAELGYKRALLVYGGGSVVRTGTLARVKESLVKAGVEFVELSGVRPNPEVASVREGIAVARENDVDLVLPVGGGSTIDCAKAIAFGVFHDGDVWDFFAKKAAIEQALPLMCVLTIPAAGSEGSSSCVISNDSIDAKFGVNSDLIRPKVSFLDPELTFTLPAYQTAAGVTDMIAHICERFFSGAGSSEATDNIATGLIRALINRLRWQLPNRKTTRLVPTLCGRARLLTTILRAAALTPCLRAVPAGGKAMPWNISFPHLTLQLPMVLVWPL